jgi:anti-anti-sigma factor
LKDFEIKTVDDVTIVGINHTRTTLNEAAAFREIVADVINSDNSKIIIDVSQCDFIDSTFFGVIVIAFKMIKSKGCELKVVEPAKNDEDIFTTSKFYRLFDLYNTRENAVKSFKNGMIT